MLLLVCSLTVSAQFFCIPLGQRSNVDSERQEIGIVSPDFPANSFLVTIWNFWASLARRVPGIGRAPPNQPTILIHALT
jgi:hypothetical protein